jgi:hypothetical protein
MLKCVAWLCMTLAVCSALAFAVHYHSNPTDEATCAVCIAAHSASPNTTFTLPSATCVAERALRVEPLSAEQLLTVFALSIRPPPNF